MRVGRGFGGWVGGLGTWAGLRVGMLPGLILGEALVEVALGPFPYGLAVYRTDQTREQEHVGVWDRIRVRENGEAAFHREEHDDRGR